MKDSITPGHNQPRAWAPIDARAVLNWQNNWLRNNQNATPEEIRVATEKAIEAGAITVKGN